MTEKVRGSAPHDVDVHVGRRVRALRRLAGLSLSDLAGRLDVSYQQLHKYETGVNRMSAATLFLVSRALGAPIASLFDGVAGDEERVHRLSRLEAVLVSPGGCDLIEAFLSMPMGLRRQYAALAKSIVDPVEPAPSLRRPVLSWSPPGA